MLIYNRFSIAIFKWVATFFFNFSALISNMVTLDSYYPQKQKLFRVLKIFRSDEGPETKIFEDLWPTKCKLNLDIMFIPSAWLKFSK